MSDQIGTPRSPEKMAPGQQAYRQRRQATETPGPADQANGQFTRLEAEIGYHFQRRELLQEALTHRSAVGAAQWNERLEFLGDAVLGLAISTELFKGGEHLFEGDLSKLRAAIVNEKCLAAKARSINLGDALNLGRGEEIAGGRDKDSILADATEALLGAVYLDGGFPAVLDLVKRKFNCELDGSSDLITTRDFKTELQEHVQGRSKELPVYEVESESGPAHQREFVVTVTIDGKTVGRGVGCSKKRASVAAAREALVAIERREKREGIESRASRANSENTSSRSSGSSRSGAAFRSEK